jgi:hypothetical protein
MSDDMLWRQQAFWYLAGIEDGRGKPIRHGIATTSGRAFIQSYVDACIAAQGKSAADYPYLPDLYQDWAKSNPT